MIVQYTIRSYTFCIRLKQFKTGEEKENRSAAENLSLSREVASGSRARQERNTSFTKSAAAHNHP